MCGIAGIFHYQTVKPVDPRRIERMTEALAHRGPDGAGFWTAPGVGLGHRRLAVIDSGGSRQPLPSSDGRAVIVCDGAIYNYRQLRHQLAQEGAQFTTNGDAEAILAGWQKWGVNCLQHLDGNFAIAIYDLEKRQLFLARDRLGAKPLYLAHLEDGSLAFASELKGLIAHPLLRREVDPLAIEDYMAWGYVPDHRSILKRVSKLPAGHFLLLEHGREPGQQRQWWDVSFADRERGSVEDLSAHLLHRMREGVTNCMETDVPPGAFLSGGVDSSSIVALMSEASAKPVTTCTIGFDETSTDEIGQARQVAQLFGTDHHERFVPFGGLVGIDRIAAIFDEPFADASALVALHSCELAREHMTVALTGEGADEVMAGHRHLLLHAREEQARMFIPAILRRPVFGTLGAMMPVGIRARSTALSLAASGEEGYARTLSILAPEQRAELYGDAMLKERGDYSAEQSFMELMRHAPARSGLDRAQYADLKFALASDVLMRTDRTSMAVGLEVREPMLDHRLIEFASRIPPNTRIRSGRGKWLMRKTMERYLPDETLYRPSQSFALPLNDWFRGPLADAAKGIVASEMLTGSGWFDRRALTRLADDHIAGRANFGRVLWQLLMLEKSLRNLAPVA